MRSPTWCAKERPQKMKKGMRRVVDIIKSLEDNQVIMARVCTR